MVSSGFISILFIYLFIFRSYLFVCSFPFNRSQRERHSCTEFHAGYATFVFSSPLLSWWFSWLGGVLGGVTWLPWWVQGALAWSHPGHVTVNAAMGPKQGLEPVRGGEQVL